MHHQIEKLQFGDEKSCSRCGQIFESRFFPYKSVALCLVCYENVHGITLHQKRSDLNRRSSAKSSSSVNRFDSKNKICPNCQAESVAVNNSGDKMCQNCKLLIARGDSHNPNECCPDCDSKRFKNKGKRNGKQRYTCADCGRNWTVDSFVGSVKKNEEDSGRETDLDEIKEYLKKQKEKNEPIVFYYRQDITPRKTNNYYLDDKYVHVKSAGSYYVTFLIDKIRKI